MKAARIDLPFFVVYSPEIRTLPIQFYEVRPACQTRLIRFVSHKFKPFPHLGDAPRNQQGDSCFTRSRSVGPGVHSAACLKGK
jgi:hypothetical protein